MEGVWNVTRGQPFSLEKIAVGAIWAWVIWALSYIVIWIWIIGDEPVHTIISDGCRPSIQRFNASGSTAIHNVKMFYWCNNWRASTGYASSLSLHSGLGIHRWAQTVHISKAGFTAETFQLKELLGSLRKDSFFFKVTSHRRKCSSSMSSFSFSW